MPRMSVREIDWEINKANRVLGFAGTDRDAISETVNRLETLRPFEVEREEREKAAKKAAHDRMAKAVSGFADAFAKAGL